MHFKQRESVHFVQTYFFVFEERKKYPVSYDDGEDVEFHLKIVLVFSANVFCAVLHTY